MIQLRPYQSESIEAAYEYCRTKDGNPLIIQPTGAGKTLTMAMMARDIVRWHYRPIIISHSPELVQQTHDEIATICPELRPSMFCNKLRKKDLSGRVVVASVQSLFYAKGNLGQFRVAMVDEADSIPNERTTGMYHDVIRRLQANDEKLRLIGLTATPYRLDGGLIYGDGMLFSDICHEAEIADLVTQGFLCPVTTRIARAEVSRSGLKVRQGEYTEASMNAAFATEQVVRTACMELIHAMRDRRKCLVFCCSSIHCELVNRFLPDAAILTYETPDRVRESIIAGFKSGHIRYLININICAVGFNVRDVDTIAMMLPTMSARLYYQQCLDMETEVLAKDGWKKCNELQIGDEVASFDMQSREIVYDEVTNKVHRPLGTGESFLSVESPHLNLRVTEGHNLVVKCNGKTAKNWNLQTASEASQRKDAFTVPVAGIGMSRQEDAKISDDEVAFAGWFLTDGYLNPHNNVVVISQSVVKFASEVRGVLMRCGLAFREYLHPRKGKHADYAPGMQFVIPKGSGRRENRHKRGWNHLAEWLNKDVPPVFDSLSTRQFAMLVHAMNLGNGSNKKTKGWTPKVLEIHYGCRKRLADRIQQLAIERGWRCNVVQLDPKPTEWNPSPQRQWMVRIKQQLAATVGGSRVDSKPRSQLTQSGSGGSENVWCVTTKHGTIVTRRKGKVVIVGNCGRGMRIHQAKAECLVLDFAGNARQHGPINRLTEWITRKEKRTSTGGRQDDDGEERVRVCPECRTANPLEFDTCMECGETLIVRREIKQDAASDKEAVLIDMDRTVDGFDKVDAVEFHIHEKQGSPASVRIIYHLAYGKSVSEWRFPEGRWTDGFAKWWKANSREPVPRDAREAVEKLNQGHVTLATHIRHRKNAKGYPEIVARRYRGDSPQIINMSGYLSF